ncbi:Protein PHYTOCHROME KINASE SUBSTRATE 1 [Hirschfeldia incana]|nr:Protein PHYTOCHROME KINASE SUBSTRATE 1 [Hirschfeldia incana]
MVTLISSSASTPKISFDFTKDNNYPNLNVPVSSPCSSYLGSKEEAVVTTKKLMEPCETLNVNNNPKYDQEIGDEKKIVKKAPEDPEIGVFGAEKYFSGDMDSDQSSSVLSLTNPEVERFVVEMKQTEKKSTGTASVCTESSWNSQSMLLKNKLVNSCNGSLQEKKTNSGQIQKVNNNKKSFLSNLRCKCCSDVDDKILVKRSSDPNTSELIKIQKQEELVQRKSPEVFGSPVNIEKKLTLPPWESRRKEEDTKSEGSDSSSDLFEIDNITGKPKPFLTRQVSDGGTPTCYAPSEVSIEWSVVTESAAGFSVMSECATSPIRKPNSSRSGGFLLSCKSYKSVMVSSDSERRSSMNKNKASPSYVPRFPLETAKPSSLETRRKLTVKL